MKVSQTFLVALVCLGGCLLGYPQQTISAENPANPNKSPEILQPSKIDDWKIEDIARQITVRVFSEENTASGTLIERQERKLAQGSLFLYLVVTNQHVIGQSSAEHSIETPDGRVHQASLHPDSKAKFQDVDLALLYFSSQISYQVATIGNSLDLKEEDTVFVGGFPCEGDFCEKVGEFIFEPGTALLLEQPLSEGYQLGFTSETISGTSGGAVLNKKGELVAINGRGKYPILNGQYDYQNGKKPSPEIVKFMRHFAWGIPIETYKRLVPKQVLSNIKQPVNTPTVASNLNPNQQEDEIAKNKDYEPENNSWNSLVRWGLVILVGIGSLGVIILLLRKHKHKNQRMVTRQKSIGEKPKETELLIALNYQTWTWLLQEAQINYYNQKQPSQQQQEDRHSWKLPLKQQLLLALVKLNDPQIYTRVFTQLGINQATADDISIEWKEFVVNRLQSYPYSDASHVCKFVVGELGFLDVKEIKVLPITTTNRL